MTSRLRQITGRLVLALGATVLALLVAEGGLRVAGLGPPPPASPFEADTLLGEEGSMALYDPDLGYRLQPNPHLLDFYRVNSLGYRGPEVPADRQPDSFRLVATGDSSTFGLGVAEEQAWPFVAGGMLQAALADVVTVEVVDAGVPGYTSLQNREQILRDLLPLQPDVLVWCPMGHNDAGDTLPPNEVVRLERRRGLAGWLRGWYLSYRLGLGPDALRIRDILPEDLPDTVPRVPLPDVERNLRRVVAACAREGVGFVLVAPPHSEAIRRHAPVELQTEFLVVAVATELGVALADPRAELDELGLRDLYPDTVHPAAEAHAVMGREVFAAIAERHADRLPASRRTFAAGWASALRSGLPAVAAELSGPDVPAELARLVAAARELPLSGAMPADAPEALRRWDPLLGSAFTLRSEASLRLALASGADPDPEALQRLAADTARHVHPRDPLLLLLDGEGGSADERADRVAARLQSGELPELLPLARALLAFTAQVAQLPAPADVRALQSRHALLAGDAEEARRLAAEALASQSANAAAELALGLALERLDRRSEALAAFERGARLAPDSVTGRFQLGRAALQRGEFQTAEEELTRALELVPADKLARLARAQARIRLDRWEDAEADLLTLRSLGTSDLPAANEMLRMVRTRLAR